VNVTTRMRDSGRPVRAGAASGELAASADERGVSTSGGVDPRLGFPVRQRGSGVEPDWVPLERFLGLLHADGRAPDLQLRDFMWMGFAGEPPGTAGGGGGGLPAIEVYKHRDTRKSFGLDAGGHAWRKRPGLGWYVYGSPLDAAIVVQDGWVPAPGGGLQPPPAVPAAGVEAWWMYSPASPPPVGGLEL
jgi:hypothetical protein